VHFCYDFSWNTYDLSVFGFLVVVVVFFPPRHVQQSISTMGWESRKEHFFALGQKKERFTHFLTPGSPTAGKKRAKIRRNHRVKIEIE